ncbi:hypothetical protein [Amycolatopsis sp. NPDC059657]|uniref:hypothetical protein n=1 Tax=Amycolatopsis sp. NPDC059657 TaxID=3346899 RepID=UPI00366A63AF
MSRDAVNNQPGRPWRARTATATALLALALVGGPSVASAAESSTWTLSGPDRATNAEAQADIPGLTSKCRSQNGRPTNSTVNLVPSGDGILYNSRAVVTCQSVR